MSRWRRRVAAHAGATQAASGRHDSSEGPIGRVDSLDQFFSVQSPDRVLYDDELGLKLACACLREDQGRKRIRGNDVSRDAPFLQFDAVMETPRRTRASIPKCKQGCPVLVGHFID
jgi:hypothetical protein